MAESTHLQICEAIRDAIQGLGLTDWPKEEELPESRIMVAWGVTVMPQGLPAVFICPAGAKQMIGGTNGSDDWAYPVAVFIVDRISQGYTPPMDAALLWREQIEEKINGNRLSAVPAVYVCESDPAPVVDPGFATSYQLLVQPLVFRCKARKLRPAGA